MFIYEVEIVRMHKSSPYNCASYLPEVKALNADDAIALPEVQTAIKRSFGRLLLVNISSLQDGTFSQYRVRKSKAVVQ